MRIETSPYRPRALCVALILVVALPVPVWAQQERTAQDPESTVPEKGPDVGEREPARRVEQLPAPKKVLRRRYDLLAAGSGILIGVWVADRLLFWNLSPSWTGWLPVAGPWFLLSEQQRLTTPSTAVSVVLSLDGIFQAAGLTLTVLGIFLKKERMVLSLPPAPARPLGGAAFSF